MTEAAADTPTIATTTLSPARAGELYRVALTAFGGTEPYTWSAIGLPEWLALDPSTGIVSGTPADEDAGDEEVWITVQDSSERPATDVRGFRVHVAAAPLLIPAETAAPVTLPRPKSRLSTRLFAFLAALLVAGIGLSLALDRSDDGSFNQSPPQTNASQSAPPTTTPVPSLAYGDTVSDQLAANETHHWSFAGEADQIVTVRAVQDGSASLRPAISLLDPGGNKLADACAPGSPVPAEARMLNKTLTFTGRHTIVISSCSSSNDPGGYRLELFLKETRALSFGSTAAGKLAFPRDYEDWQFEGTEGDLVTVIMAKEGASTLDPILTLLDPGGNKLTSRYHCDGSFSEHTIDQYELAFTGTYTIRAEACGSTTGAFSISLSQ